MIGISLRKFTTNLQLMPIRIRLAGSGMAVRQGEKFTMDWKSPQIDDRLMIQMKLKDCR